MKYFLIILSIVFTVGSALGQAPNNKAVALNGTSNVEAALSGTLDVKKAKVGDSVVLKTTQAVKQNGEVVIPKGANIVGRVTDVARKGKTGAASRIGMVFDRVEGKNLDSPITATITAITAVGGAANVGNAGGGDIMSDSSVMGGGSTGGRSSGGGGGGGGLLGGVGGTVGGVLNTTTNTVGGVTNTIGGATSSVTSGVGQTVNGISLSQSAEGSLTGSTVLSSGGNNLRLEKGATFRVAVSSGTGKQP